MIKIEGRCYIDSDELLELLRAAGREKIKKSAFTTYIRRGKLPAPAYKHLGRNLFDEEQAKQAIKQFFGIIKVSKNENLRDELE